LISLQIKEISIIYVLYQLHITTSSALNGLQVKSATAPPH